MKVVVENTRRDKNHRKFFKKTLKNLLTKQIKCGIMTKLRKIRDMLPKGTCFQEKAN